MAFSRKRSEREDSAGGRVKPGSSATRAEGAPRRGSAPSSGKTQHGSEKRTRHAKIGFRASDEEQARIEAAASRAGLTVGSYLRSRALAKPTTRAVRRAPVETAQLAQLLGLLGAPGGELQRLSKGHSADEHGPAEELKAAIDDVRAAASAILRALGKRT
jgi:uncharacterized protein (DUF1778 family)